jgi:hypothetical protein
MLLGQVSKIDANDLEQHKNRTMVDKKQKTRKSKKRKKTKKEEEEEKKIKKNTLEKNY